MEIMTRFCDDLAASVTKKLHVRFNNNRSTMLSVSSDRNQIRLSLHRMFLNAPPHVREALKKYLRGGRHNDGSQVAIRAFVEENLRKLDYSHVVDNKDLCSKGDAYDLQEIYDRLNAKYFQGAVRLRITWYGQVRKRRRNLTFGLYDHPLKLIKVHRQLDNPDVPLYVVEFVVYHEMSHHMQPTRLDGKGVLRVHHRDFKALEKRFDEYAVAEQWIRGNKEGLFSGNIGK